jgi:large subunit ribosomal protein L7/L12
VIKVLRGLTGFGLREAKALTDAVPRVVADGLAEEPAERAAEALRSAGATVDVDRMLAGVSVRDSYAGPASTA